MRGVGDVRRCTCGGPFYHTREDGDPQMPRVAAKPRIPEEDAISGLPSTTGSYKGAAVGQEAQNPLLLALQSPDSARWTVDGSRAGPGSNQAPEPTALTLLHTGP